MRLCYNIYDWHGSSCRAGKTSGIPLQKEYGKKYKFELSGRCDTGLLTEQAILWPKRRE